MPIHVPEMDPCYFCRIIAGDLHQWGVIEQAALTLTVLNGRQYEVGQCLVVPRRHAPTLLDLREEEGAAVMAATRRVTHVLVKAFDPDGILVYQSNGLGSGQEVPHFHVHVVPRRLQSEWGFGPPQLAEVARGAAHLDHREITDDKRKTAEGLRQLASAM